MPKTWLFFHATKPEGGELKRKIKAQNAQFYQIGIGREAVSKSVPPILSEWSEKGGCFVIHFGISGALDETLKTGDLILPTEFIDSNGTVLSHSSEIIQRSELFLKELDLPYKKGRLFTGPHVLKTPEEKKDAGSSRSAIAVDMETYPVAKMCHEKDIPFLSIRAIFDLLNWDLTRLSEADFIDAKGDLSVSRFAKKIVQSPRLLMSLPKYQKALATANRNLSRFIVTALNKWGW